MQAAPKSGAHTDNEEFFTGVVAVAVPIAGPGKSVFAAIAVHGPAAFVKGLSL